MPILYDDSTRIFRVDSATASYAFCVGPFDYLQHLYFGARLSDVELGYLAYTGSHASFSPRVEMSDRFSKDTARLEYAGHGCGDCRGSSLMVRTENGSAATDLRYVSHKIYGGKPAIPGQPATYAEEGEADTLEILCRDDATGVEVTLFYTAFADNAAITRRAVVKNTATRTVKIEKVMSACVDFNDGRDLDFVHLYGDWAKERIFERAPLLHGTQSVGSRRGSSSHAHNPFIALVSHDVTEQHGDAYGFNLVYSGNFIAEVELNADGTTRAHMGIHPDDFCWVLEPDQTFYTPEVVMVYSNEGLGGMSRAFHRLYRHHLCRGKWKIQKRPILVNNWEGTYFDFNEEKLLAIAKDAAELGIEMLVMDDGWFGKRDNDKSGLGDWYVNENKLKGGLAPLVKGVHDLGMRFGIWFEPEMISLDSDLYRAHPEWALQIPGRPMSIGRHQYVLDMSRADVRDYLFASMKKILDSAKIDYVKWDFNRNLSEVYSTLLEADHQGEVFHRYVLGLYDLLERLLTAYPDLLLEGCSGGGGRFDPAMLYYSPQIWTSDNTDAIERIDIQYGTSMCYPTSSMGAHVSASPNHVLHRSSTQELRGHVALAGSFGYELDLTKMSQAERELIKSQCADYHKYYDVIHNGDLYRLISPFADRTRCAWSYVSEDKREVLLTYVAIRSRVNDRHYVRLAGLDPDRRYREEQSGLVLTGKALMSAGWVIPERLFDKTSRQYHFVAVD